MANDRKLLTADFIRLKAKVKAEMLRRSYSGSVSAYGGASYDFSAPPRDDAPVLGEHLKKNLEPMRQVNGDGLPTYPGTLTTHEQEIMETKVNAWATRSVTDRGGTDCKSGCTGTCFSACTTGCYTGCSSCTGCAGSCTGGCTGCSETCQGCSGSCTNGCTGCSGGCVSCGNACTATCQNNCFYCAGSCNGDTTS